MKKMVAKIWLLVSISISSVYTMETMDLQSIKSIVTKIAQETAQDIGDELYTTIRNRLIIAAVIASAIIATQYYLKLKSRDKQPVSELEPTEIPISEHLDTSKEAQPEEGLQEMDDGAGVGDYPLDERDVTIAEVEERFEATVINFKSDGSVDVITIPEYALEPNTIIVQDNGNPYATVVQAKEYKKYRDLISLIKNHRKKLSSSPSNEGQAPSYIQELQERLGTRSSRRSLHRQPITVLTKDAVDSILYPASSRSVQLPGMAQLSNK